MMQNSEVLGDFCAYYGVFSLQNFPNAIEFSKKTRKNKKADKFSLFIFNLICTPLCASTR
jgi:hypothetical protein